MIKVELVDKILAFANGDAFGQWLVDNGYCRDFQTFTDEEYTAYEILVKLYNYEEVKDHWWRSEVYDTVYEWINSGLAEEK